MATPNAADRDQRDPADQPGIDATADLPLPDPEMDDVAGGRDPANGLPTGQRMYKPTS
jgi:hypothetical protein